jgi:maltose/moltooligosaccharide transporter
MNNKQKPRQKPTLSFWQIWNMSFGFLGIQYGFGLQQANLSPIFRYLDADEAKLPVLWLAGPITGLLIQPLIGAISDGTWTRFGRRKPFFVIGALVGSIAVMLMPYSPALWVAVGLFWILDAAMNTAQEPYRALVGDKLNDQQRAVGFSVQTFMIGAGQILAGLMPLILLGLGISADTQDGKVIPDIVKYSFVIGVAAMLLTVLWTAWKTDEYPPENLDAFRAEAAKRGGVVSQFIHIFTDIFVAIKEMPKGVRQIWWVKFFTWYGMPLMWQYLALSIARHCYNAPTPESPGFAEGTAKMGLAMTVMNITTIVMSFVIPPVVHRIGTRMTYALFLALGGLGFVSMLFTNSINVVLAGMVGVGIGWSAILTVPFIITTRIVPPARTGVYMGILNAFICIPQIMEMLTVGLYYDQLLGGDARNAIVLAGGCLILGAVACLFISKDVEAVTTEEVFEAEARGMTLGEV